jgi:transcription elongation factor Elf1
MVSTPLHIGVDTMASVPTLTCPYCHHTFVGVKVTQHGLIKCGKCGKTVRI